MGPARGRSAGTSTGRKAQKRALFGARVHGSGELIVITARAKDSAAFCRFLAQLKPKDDKPLHLVLDNGPIHKSRMSRAALAAAADWLTIEWLPTYAPELNDIERDWRHLKTHYLAHQTFVNIDTLERTLQISIQHINAQRLNGSCARLWRAA